MTDTDNKTLAGSAKCTGCGVCLLTCPVWRRTGDIMFTACGRARALQNGGTPEEMSDSLAACVLCGSCAPVCPAGVDTVALTTELRALLAERKGAAPAAAEAGTPPAEKASGTVFFPGQALRENEKLLLRAQRLLEAGGAALRDDAAVSALSAKIEAGARPEPGTLRDFTAALAGAGGIIAADGFLHRHLREWLPGVRVGGLGEALLRRPDVRKALKRTDLYVIEARGYHADHARLVNFYDEMRRETGCGLNTSLQRTAIPTGATSRRDRPGPGRVDAEEQARWILEKRRAERVVTEAVEDMKLFKKIPGLQVVHITELLN